jgi:1-phosphatidylinositol-3-phosphate 5-kinase
VEELAKTAFAPQHPFSESEQEYSPTLPRISTKSKSRHLPIRKASISDFEQGYAANVAPRHLTHPRRVSGQLANSSRIPGPVGESSLESSRRPSPQKRNSSNAITKAETASASLTPPPGRKDSATAVGHKSGKSRANSTHPRPSPSVGNKSSFRRSTGGPGSKVSNIAKHFERINRDNERSNRRYAVIRGKRARPVASVPAKVEVLGSYNDAIKDDSDSSDSSEADDEEDDDEHCQKPSEKPIPEVEIHAPIPEVVIETTTPDSSASPPIEDPQTVQKESNVPPESSAASVTSPPSPNVPPFKPSDLPSQVPPDFDIGPGGTELPSILKAISGLWLPQSRNRVDFEADDPTSDPEHIFRDSSMVARTDEPTSIIALALKFVSDPSSLIVS